MRRTNKENADYRSKIHLMRFLISLLEQSRYDLLIPHSAIALRLLDE